MLAAAAIVCLPRQFLVGVVECADPADLRKARWLFPAYLAVFSALRRAGGTCRPRLGSGSRAPPARCLRAHPADGARRDRPRDPRVPRRPVGGHGDGGGVEHRARDDDHQRPRHARAVAQPLARTRHWRRRRPAGAVATARGDRAARRARLRLPPQHRLAREPRLDRAARLRGRRAVRACDPRRPVLARCDARRRVLGPGSRLRRVDLHAAAADPRRGTLRRHAAAGRRGAGRRRQRARAGVRLAAARRLAARAHDGDGVPARCAARAGRCRRGRRARRRPARGHRAHPRHGDRRGGAA